MKIYPFLFFIIFFIQLNLINAEALTIHGNNLCWSPADENKFIYSSYGKKSENSIWHLYNIGNNNEDTIYFGESTKPLWLYNGKNIIFTKNNKIIIYENNSQKEFASSSENITSVDVSLKSDKILYSDGYKINIFDVNNNNNSFIINGHDPVYFDNDNKILFLDENLQVNVLDESLKTTVVLKDIVKKILPLKNDNKFLYLYNNTINLFDFQDQTVYPIVEESTEIINFNIGFNNDFLVYNSKPGDVFLVHIPTKLKVKIYSDKDCFSQKLSFQNKYCAFEKNEQIIINNIEEQVKAFNINNIFKVALGVKDGINTQMQLEIYEKKINPFTQKVIGYEPEQFKGVLKIISVYNGYSYGILDKENSTGKAIGSGDIALWKEKNITAAIEK